MVQAVIPQSKLEYFGLMRSFFRDVNGTTHGNEERSNCLFLADKVLYLALPLIIALNLLLLPFIAFHNLCVNEIANPLPRIQPAIQPAIPDLPPRRFSVEQDAAFLRQLIPLDINPYGILISIYSTLRKNYPHFEIPELTLNSIRAATYDYVYRPMGGNFIIATAPQIGHEINFKGPHGPFRFYVNHEGDAVASPEDALNVNARY